ncbi:MAG: hypothetical protein ACKVOR_11170 [Flavobacteriales bacterium]
MLTISKNQYAKIEIALRRSFVDRLVERSRLEYSVKSAAMNNEELEIHLNEMINKATNYDIAHENYVSLYIDWTWKYGKNFENYALMKNVKHFLEDNITPLEVKLPDIVRELSKLKWN